MKGHPSEPEDNILSWDDFIRMGRDISPDSKFGHQLTERQQGLRPNKCCSVVYTVILYDSR